MIIDCHMHERRERIFNPSKTGNPPFLTSTSINCGLAPLGLSGRS